VKFLCYININSTAEEDFKQNSGADPMTYSEEYRRRLIDNNFELMNGTTIQVTTDPSKIPKYFVKLEDLNQLKAAVAQEMDNGGTLNLNLLENSTRANQLSSNLEEEIFQQRRQ
jgi:hypothetical protein